MGKLHVYIERLNWDTLYYSQLISGLGFTITEPAAVSIDGMKKKSLFGPRSELYGTTYGDEQEFAEQYRCQCGLTTGRLREGETCPYCHTVVKTVGDNIRITGWIPINGYKIINPYFFVQLRQVIGKDEFNDIVTSRKKVDKNGNISRPDIYADPDKPPLSPFSGIGLTEFYDRYEEILEYYKKKRGKGKLQKVDFLLSHKNYVFTSHIPVYSTKLRQQSITADTFYYGGLDKCINPIISLSKLLDDASEIEIDSYLQRIQMNVNKIFEYNFDLLDDKDGLIRGQMLGGAINFSSRNVITPDASLRDNEVAMSYQTFLELFKGQIIKHLQITEDLTISQANNEWYKAKIRFSEKIYQVMCYLVKNKNPLILLNRNPTLRDLGSLNLSNCGEVRLCV